MTWLWIVLILLFLLCITRVGAKASIAGGTLALDVKFGLFSFRILPRKKKAPDPEKEAKKEAKAAAAAMKKEAKKEAQKAAKAAQKEARKGEKLAVKTERLKVLLADVESAIDALWPPLKRALDRTRRGIRIHPLQLSLTVGGEKDPAAAAQLYGYLHAGVWNVMPVLEKLLDIPSPYIHVGLDFESPDTTVEGEAGLTIRVGTLLAVGAGVAFPALKWFLKWNQKKKQAKKQALPAVATKKG